MTDALHYQREEYKKLLSHLHTDPASKRGIEELSRTKGGLATHFPKDALESVKRGEEIKKRGRIEGATDANGYYRDTITSLKQRSKDANVQFANTATEAEGDPIEDIRILFEGEEEFYRFEVTPERESTTLPPKLKLIDAQEEAQLETPAEERRLINSNKRSLLQQLIEECVRGWPALQRAIAFLSPQSKQEISHEAPKVTAIEEPLQLTPKLPSPEEVAISTADSPGEEEVSLITALIEVMKKAQQLRQEEELFSTEAIRTTQSELKELQKELNDEVDKLIARKGATEALEWVNASFAAASAILGIIAVGTGGIGAIGIALSAGLALLGGGLQATGAILNFQNKRTQASMEQIRGTQEDAKRKIHGELEKMRASMEAVASLYYQMVEAAKNNYQAGRFNGGVPTA